MSKKIIFIISGIFVVAIVAVTLLSGEGGVSIPLPSFETIGSDVNTVTRTASVDDLEDGCFYVWHNDEVDDISADLEGAASLEVFRICPEGERNWKKDDTSINHVLWFDSESDQDIPTLYEGDELLYVSSTEIPFKGISWERYADYGYSIGVANLISDESGHYHIENPEGKGFVGYVYDKSDAVSLEDFTDITALFIDKVGKTKVRDGLVSEGGTVKGLEKNGAYACEWYSGSYYQDFQMTANVHPFCALETFTTYDYEFLHSSCISITIPEWFKTGYYYANNIGLFRYVKGSDGNRYSGEPYDSSIDWNDRIIIKDEKGNVVYDPSTGYTDPLLNSDDLYSDNDSEKTGSIIDSEDQDDTDDDGNIESEENADRMDGDPGMDEIDEDVNVVVP